MMMLIEIKFIKRNYQYIIKALLSSLTLIFFIEMFKQLVASDCAFKPNRIVIILQCSVFNKL